MSDYQLEFFTNRRWLASVGQQGNNRMTQPLNDRKVYYKGLGMDGSLMESNEVTSSDEVTDSDAVTLTAASALALITLLSF